MSLPSIDELMGMEISAGYGDPVPIGFYDAVITAVEVRGGNKGPYLNITTTVHEEGDYFSRKVWGISSFSEKALGMPGGVAELLQTTGAGETIDRSLPAEELPAAIAEAVLHSPIVIEVDHEQVKRNNVLQFNADDTPEMRARVRSYSAAKPEFIEAIKAEAAGLDEDLPF